MQGFVGISILVILSFRQVKCYSGGPPITACDSMKPEHGAVAQNSAPPYTIMTESSTYCPGQHVHVTLTSKNESYYQGVFVQARYGSTRTPVGTWVTDDMAKMKTLNCSDHSASAISHSTKEKKYEQVLVWRAPINGGADVNFVGTFVKEMAEFWIDVKSKPISLTVCSAGNTVKHRSYYHALFPFMAATAAILQIQ